MKQTVIIFKQGVVVQQKSLELTPSEYVELQHLSCLDLVIKQKETMQEILSVGVNN